VASDQPAVETSALALVEGNLTGRVAVSQPFLAELGRSVNRLPG
jgi:hypothetical protein